MFYGEPTWMDELKMANKKKSIDILRSHHLKKSFLNKEQLYAYVKKEVRWLYELEWRQEQKLAIDSFFKDEWQELVIQAVFGSGKTTIMLAIIQNILFHKFIDASNIFIMAFNVAIKNEIKKKLHNSALSIRTFDSLIYLICKEQGLEDLHLPNFETKRRYVKDNIDKVSPNEIIKYVFVDETQDLEKSCYKILKHRFPNARFLFIGDVFQSIQKEPRESLLWFLLQDKKPERKIFTMKKTPRVPKNILKEISQALLQFYPEFSDTIRTWSSTNQISEANIYWSSFKSYKEVYNDLLIFCDKYDHKDIMVLTFSSAITVRGSLGDVARVRKFLNSSGILTNSNHKNMMSDRVFISTANSSKGLERDHVFCFLTFPLEKAFSNFSDDLVVNIVTVALSRAKKTICIYIPNHKDRFSNVLHLYQKCPKPTINNVMLKKPLPLISDNPFNVDIYDMKTMLEQEHGVTELLRQNILSFETKKILKTFAKKYDTKKILPIHLHDLKTEEHCAFVGVLFETLILSHWTNKWLTDACTDNLVNQHEMFSNFVSRIGNLSKQYNLYIKRYPFNGQKIVFQGCLLFAKLHIACYQKIFIDLTKDQESNLYGYWKTLYPFIHEIKPCNLSKLKTQHNVSMDFVTGIADAIILNDVIEVIEIKASRSPEWNEHALIQAMCYGLMLGKSYFKIHLLNVANKEFYSYAISFKGKLMEMRRLLQQEIAVWNMNCFLAKNVTHNDTQKKSRFDIDGLFLLDGRISENKYTLVEMSSATKTFIICNQVEKNQIIDEIKKRKIKKLLISRFLEDDDFDGIKLQFNKNYFGVSKYNLWIQFLEHIGWNEEKPKLDWMMPLSTISVQICRIAQLYNF